MATNTAKMKAELEAKTGQLAPEKGTKLKKSMSIAEMIKVMEPEIKRALPEVITPERFTRMALSALNTIQKLAECSHMSFFIGVDERSPARTRTEYASWTGIFNSL